MEAEIWWHAEKNWFSLFIVKYMTFNEIFMSMMSFKANHSIISKNGCLSLGSDTTAWTFERKKINKTDNGNRNCNMWND